MINELVVERQNQGSPCKLFCGCIVCRT